MKNLGKKEQRLQLLEYKTKALTEKGYIKETYRDLLIFTNEPELTLKIFRGTATNPIHFVRYRTLERLEQVKNTYKEYADAREKRKQDEAGNRVLSQSAQCAAAIRAELKDKFPHCKFSVTSSNFSGGNSVHIDWKDGATVAQVEAITGKYQYGSINGMEDIYEYTNSREDIPQAKYVQEHRELSESIVIEVAEQLQKVKHYTEQEIYSYNENPQTDARKLLYLTEIPYNYTGLKVVVNDNSTTYSDYFKIVFETPKQETQQSQQVETQSTEAANTGKIQIVDYSNKAIAVIGDTKPIKELLKSLGGSFNARLSCGPGWIFSKKKLQELQTALINHAKTSTEEPQPENINLPVLYTSTPSNVQNIEEAEIIEETPTGKALSLEYFKILWHEGHQNPNYTDAIFTNWQEVQKAFYKLWEVNEKGQDGGYTKVKCEIKFKGVDAVTDRIDITNRVNNGDFNPSQMHVLEYLRQTILEEGEEIEEPAKDWRKHPELEHRHPLNIWDPESNQYKEALKEYEAEHPKKYKNIIDITAAAKSGKPISIYNLFDIVNTQTVNA